MPNATYSIVVLIEGYSNNEKVHVVERQKNVLKNKKDQNNTNMNFSLFFLDKYFSHILTLSNTDLFRPIF